MGERRLLLKIAAPIALPGQRGRQSALNDSELPPCAALQGTKRTCCKAVVKLGTLAALLSLTVRRRVRGGG